MANIAELHRLPPAVKMIVDERLALASAEVDLYSGRRFSALSGFARALPAARRQGELAKQSLRFAIGAALGPRALTWLAGRSG
jgi:hypothetical protein